MGSKSLCNHEISLLLAVRKLSFLYNVGWVCEDSVRFLLLLSPLIYYFLNLWDKIVNNFLTLTSLWYIKLPSLWHVSFIETLPANRMGYNENRFKSKPLLVISKLICGLQWARTETKPIWCGWGFDLQERISDWLQSNVFRLHWASTPVTINSVVTLHSQDIFWFTKTI
jgi:hypothetical protein